MLSYIRVLIICSLFSGSVWGKVPDIASIIDNPSYYLSVMSDDSKIKLLEEFMEKEYSSNIQVKNFILKSLAEKFREADNEYAKLGYFVHLNIYVNKTKSDIEGTVYEKVLESLPKYIQDMSEQYEGIDVGYAFFIHTMEAFARYQELMADRDLEYKNFQRIIESHTSALQEQATMLQQETKIIKQRIVDFNNYKKNLWHNIKKSIMFYTFGKEAQIQLGDITLAREFLGKILEDLESIESKKRIKAINMLTNPVTEKFLSRILGSSLVIKSLEGLRAASSKGGEVLFETKLLETTEVIKRFIEIK